MRRIYVYIHQRQGSREPDDVLLPCAKYPATRATGASTDTLGCCIVRRAPPSTHINIASSPHCRVSVVLATGLNDRDKAKFHAFRVVQPPARTCESWNKREHQSSIACYLKLVQSAVEKLLNSPVAIGTAFEIFIHRHCRFFAPFDTCIGNQLGTARTL